MRLLAIAAAAAMVTLVACGHSAAPVGAPAPVTRPATPAATPDASPSPVPARRLTIAQARRTYRQLGVPFNRSAITLNTEWGARIPVGQYHSELARNSAVVRAYIRRLRAVRWPRRVRATITAMTLTVLPDTIRCNRAEQRAGSYDAMNAIFEDDQVCIGSQDSTHFKAARAALGLPARS